MTLEDPQICARLRAVQATPMEKEIRHALGKLWKFMKSSLSFWSRWFCIYIFFFLHRLNVIRDFFEVPTNFQCNNVNGCAVFWQLFIFVQSFSQQRENKKWIWNTITSSAAREYNRMIDGVLLNTSDIVFPIGFFPIGCQNALVTLDEHFCSSHRAKYEFIAWCSMKLTFGFYVHLYIYFYFFSLWLQPSGILFPLVCTELQKKCMLAICREWSSSGDGDRIVLDRTRRDRLKKLKTLLRTCLPAEQYAEITWVFVFSILLWLDARKI